MTPSVRSRPPDSGPSVTFLWHGPYPAHSPFFSFSGIAGRLAAYTRFLADKTFTESARASGRYLAEVTSSPVRVHEAG